MAMMPSRRCSASTAQIRASTVVRRFFTKHSKSKLENPAFITNLMKLTDDEIRSKCKARYPANRCARALRTSAKANFDFFGIYKCDGCDSVTDSAHRRLAV